MILSEDRQSHWGHIITDGVYEDDLVDFSDEDFALRLAKQAIVEFVKEDEAIDSHAREKVGGPSNAVSKKGHRSGTSYIANITKKNERGAAMAKKTQKKPVKKAKKRRLQNRHLPKKQK